MVETIDFNGTTFRRYPESKHRTDRVYFTPGIAAKQSGVRRLHEEIWISHHGDIPEGTHIHHKDGNPLNNDISNLDCVTPQEHIGAHLTDERREQLRGFAAKAQPLARAWHSSPEGLEWHRKHAAESIHKPVKGECDRCGKPYERGANATFAPTFVRTPSSERPATSMRLGVAPSAESPSRPTATDPPRLVPARVVANSPAGRAAVFNLTVEDQPEFFANGLLVHNCMDCWRMLALERIWGPPVERRTPFAPFGATPVYTGLAPRPRRKRPETSSIGVA